MSSLQELSTNAETFGILYELSKELNTGMRRNFTCMSPMPLKLKRYVVYLIVGLSQEELRASLRLIESGADPTALALVVKQLKEEAKKLKEAAHR